MNRTRAALLCVMVLVLTGLATAGSALAAGDGYGGGDTGSNATPAAFSAVEQTASANSSSQSATAGSGDFNFSVPKGSSDTTLTIVVFKGSSSSVENSVSTDLAKRHLVTSFGIGLYHGASATSSKKTISTTYHHATLKRGDVLAVYNAKTKKFVPTKAVFAKGKVTFTLKAGQSYAIFS